MGLRFTASPLPFPVRKNSRYPVLKQHSFQALFHPAGDGKPPDRPNSDTRRYRRLMNQKMIVRMTLTISEVISGK